MLPTAVFAHSDLVTAIPEPGGIVNINFSEITLIFSEPVGEDSTILLFGEGFELIPVTTSLDLSEPSKLIGVIKQPLAVGEYSVQYTAVSPDGHEITGSYQFQVSYRIFNFNLNTNAILLFLASSTGIVIIFLFRHNKSKSKV